MSKKRRGKGEGGLRQRPDGRWEATVPLGGGKRKYIYGRTKRQAIEKRKQWEREHAGLPGADVDQRLTLETWVRHWCAINPRASEKTRDGYLSTADLYLFGPLGSTPIVTLTAGHVERVYRSMLDRGLSPRTCRKAHEVVRAALNAAVRSGKLRANPIVGASLPEQTQPEKTALDRDQAGRLWRSLSPFWYGPAIRLVGHTGLRLSELRGLRWKWVDLEAGALHVRETVVRHGGEWIVKDAKSARSRRTIPLIDGALAALMEAEGADLVFPREDLSTPLAYETLSGQLDEACGVAGVPRVTLHELRHTAGSMMLLAGVPMLVVSRLLGHADVATTDRVYAHVVDAPARRAMDDLQAYMEG